MDTERWILDTIEFDRAIAGGRRSSPSCNPDTLVIVTADHECAGVNIIGGSRVTNAALVARAASGGGRPQLRNGVVGTYEPAGFPRYAIAADGYPETTDIDCRMLIGYAAQRRPLRGLADQSAAAARHASSPSNGAAAAQHLPRRPARPRRRAATSSSPARCRTRSRRTPPPTSPLSAFGRGRARPSPA